MLAKPLNNILYKIEKERLSIGLLKKLSLVTSAATLEHFKLYASNALSYSLIRVADSAYREAAKDVNESVDVGKGLLLRRQMLSFASDTAIQIAQTSGIALGITAAMSPARAVSKERADLIAVNNLAVAFFKGTRFGWGLDTSSRKRWHVSDAHDNDDLCDDNEDDGAIGIDEPFQSGDFEPPAHIGCECEMVLV